MAKFYLKKQVLILLGFSGLFLISACAIVTEPVPLPKQTANGFTLFLQPLPQELQSLSFTVEGITALRADGPDVPLNVLFNTFPDRDVSNRQRRLVQAHLPPGEYRGLALTIGSAHILSDGDLIKLHAPKEPLQLEYHFVIRQDETLSLMLSLDGDRLLTNGVFFTPRFALWEAERILDALKGFTASRSTENVTCFNKHTSQVVRAWKIGRSEDLLIDRQRGLLYVALANDNNIAVVDFRLGGQVGRFQLRFTDRPIEMALTAAGSRLLVLNAGSDTLTSFDTQTFSELWRTRLSEEPEALIIGADQNTAFVTHARTGSLSVISSQTGQIRNKVRLEVDPVDGVMAEDGRFLFLIGRYATELLVLDVASLQTAERIYLGEGATVIAFDRRKNLLYVGKDNGEIAVVDPRALIAVDNYILESIPIEAIAIDEEENALFVLQPANKSLIKIDLVSKEELGHIELEEGSHSVVVMGER